MSNATAKQKKLHVSKRKSSGSLRGFLSSGCQLKRLFQLSLAGVGLLAAISAGVYYHEHYFVVVPQGVFFAGQDVSGLSRPDALALVEQVADRYEEQRLQIGVQSTESLAQGMHASAEDVQALPAREWGVEVDVSQTVADLFQMSDLFGKADVLGAAAVNDKKFILPKFIIRDLDHVLAWIQKHEREPRDASLSFDEASKQWILSPDREGLKYADDQRDQLEEKLQALLLSEGQQKKLSVSLQRLPATMVMADLVPLYDQIQAMKAPKVTWVVEGQSTIFSLADHQDMIVVDLEANNVGLDEGLLKDFVKGVAATIDQPAGAILANEAVKQDKGYLQSTYTGNFDKGRVLDQDDLFQKILQALSSGSLETTVEPMVNQKGPSVVLAGTGELTLLSQGKSSFKLGNIPDRIHNVKFGLSKYDGVVIPVGEEFSFNQKLGIVTYAAGWKPALAIFGGGGVAMVPGGGLCQVSTTMYRAAIWAGLPIKQRKPHSLDVSYYHEYGYGIDATVYPPANLDLRFINDTPGPIFIHAYTVDDETNAYVEFYGQSDGRSVELESTDNYAYVNKKTGKHQRYIAWDWIVKHADGTADNRQIETVYYGGH